MRLAKIPVGLLINFNVTKLQTVSNVWFSKSPFVLFVSFAVEK